MTMADWSEGYATGAGYLHGYFSDLNPLHAGFSLLLEGLDGPPPGPCCELGFGQGLSLAMHAAGDPGRRWWGNDFMPEHAAQAQSLVDAAGVDAVISDQSFEAFFARHDLPRFAFVGLHGVWSWVSPANRARIVAFLDSHLLPGGVVYVSFNALAGWAAVQPLRDLLRQHFTRAGPPGRPEVRRAAESLAFLQRVIAADPQLLSDTPALRERVAEWSAGSAHYLLHELLNEDWHPMSFAELAQELRGARLSHACASELHLRMAQLSLTSAQQALLAEIEDPGLRESTKDSFTARKFRREYWVRGARPLSRAEIGRRLQAQRVVLAVPRADVPGTLNGLRGSVKLPSDQLDIVVGLLEKADAPLPAGQLLQAAAARGIDGNAMVELLAALVGAQALLLAADEGRVQAARPATRRLNAHLLAPHARRTEIQHLASPVTGGGLAVPTSLQLMLAARAAAPQEPGQWPGLLWDAMQAEGQQLQADGQPVTDRAAATALLRPRVQTMLDQTLPQLRRMGIVE